MSSAPGRRTIDTDILQVRRILYKTAQNSNIAPSSVLISDGSGGTYWSTVDSIYPSYPSFVSSVAFNATAWNYNTAIGVSTIVGDTNFTEGDFYFSTIAIQMSNYLPYLQPTSKVFVEIHPNYVFPPMVAGTNSNLDLIKPVSTFLTYQTTASLSNAVSAFMTTQQLESVSFAARNAFTTPLLIPVDTTAVLSNYTEPWTVYHRVVAGMLQTTGGGGAGDRGGFSNPTTVGNYTGQNSVFVHVYNDPH